jgi:hypothetical protein
VPHTVDDEDVVYLRVPPSSPWFENNRVTTANVGLEADELGLSVYRRSVVTGQQVLEKPGAIAGSFLLEARVGDIRDLKDGAGNSLQLDVVAVDDENDAGHAEIRSPTGKLTKAARKALRDLFQRA